MDPSNFGSFSSGGDSGGAGVSGAPNDGVATGTNPTVSSGQPNPVQPQGFGGVQPQMMQSQFLTQPQMVVSGSSDVVLGGAEPRKSRKRLIIVVAVIIFSCVTVGILLLFNSLSSKNDSNNVDANLVKESFNKYVNYILFGSDSSNDITEASLTSTTPYFESLDNVEREQYINISSQKFADFSGLYYSNFGKYALDGIDTYFEQYASLGPLTENDIITEYVTEGRERTQNTVNNLFNSFRFKDMNEKLDQYVDAEKSLAKTWLNIAISAEESGCVDKTEIIVGCYQISGEERANLNRFRDTSERLVLSMKVDAMVTLLEVYKEIYGIEDSVEN